MEIPAITNPQPSGDDAKFWLHYSSFDIKTAKRHRRSQFEMLRAEYETLFNSPISALHADAGGAAVATVIDPAAIAQQIIDKYRQKPETLDWPTVHKFHCCVLHMLPDARLKRAGWALRERYRDMFGEREYGEYLDSKPPDLNGTASFSRESILADLYQLLEIFYGTYAMGPDNSRLLHHRTVQTMITIGIAVTAFGVLLALFHANKAQELGATILTVCYAGAMGGFVSALQRLRQLGGSGDSLTDYHEIQSVGYTTIIAAGMIGALFAGVLYLLFAAGLIQGSLFPNLGTGESTQTLENRAAKTEQPPNGGAPAQQPAAEVRAPSESRRNVYNFLSERLPRDSHDFALLFVWSFLAGFFERLVPDNLARLLAKKAELPT
ncbi:MAG TPA: hypothetical protein VMR62_14650 [Bryobacteraceae bacterium]|jgi:hypothetical protein|nr:hypothetical protein [Bryobacteraceae bacterium]